MSCGSQNESCHQSYQQPPCLQSPVASVCPVEPRVTRHSPVAALCPPCLDDFWKHSCPSFLCTWPQAGHSAPSLGSGLPLLTLTECSAEHLPCCLLVAPREESTAGRPGALSSGKPPFCPAGQATSGPRSSGRPGSALRLCPVPPPSAFLAKEPTPDCFPFLPLCL